MAKKVIQYTVEYEWIPDDQVWVVTSPNIIGLTIEETTLEKAMEATVELVPILLEANCQECPA